MMNYKVYEDNAGGIHLAVFDETETCVFWLADNPDGNLVRDCINNGLLMGEDPISGGWEGGEEDPQACYDQMEDFVAARNGGAAEVTDTWR